MKENDNKQRKEKTRTKTTITYLSSEQVLKCPRDFGPEQAQESTMAIAKGTKIFGQVVGSETACWAQKMVVVKREVSNGL